LGPTQTICTGFPVSLASGVNPTGVTFQWQQTTTTNFFGQPNNFTNISGQSGQNMTITPAASPTFYRVIVTSAGGCQGTSTVRINQGSGAFGISTTKNFLCQGESVTLSLPSSLTSYSWSTGTNANQALTISPLTNTTFSVTSTTAGCTGSASVTIPVRPIQVVNASATPVSPCAGTPVLLSGGPPSSSVTVNENFEGTTQSYTLVNGARNNWFHGTAAFASGTKGLYVGTASTNNNYEIGTAFGSRAATNFAYRDYAVSSFCNPNLSFKWRCNGSSGNAELTVWAITNNAVPAVGTVGNSLVAGPNTILLSGPLFGQPTTYQTVNLNLSQFAGTTVRIVFQWRNLGQNLFGSIPAEANPAASIDDIVFSESTTFTYSWTSSSGTFNSAAQSPTAVINSNTVFTLSATRCDGCVAQAFTTVTLCALLGIELSSFDAECDNGHVKISWATENDDNIAEYILQHSSNGIDFYEIEFFKAGTNFYETIAAANFENNYYRLKFIGNDASVEYSNIIQKSCDRGQLGEITLSPNPASGSINISFNVPTKGKYRLSIIDLLGRVLIKKEISLDENLQNILLNTEELSPAVYNIKIEETNSLYSPKIIKFIKK
jgi:hypothetical protein